MKFLCILILFVFLGLGGVVVYLSFRGKCPKNKSIDRLVLELEKHAGSHSHPQWYSLGIDHPALLWMGKTREARLTWLQTHLDKSKTKLNLFQFQDKWFVGTEKRRLDYERDKKNGANHVESLIEQGVYD